MQPTLYTLTGNLLWEHTLGFPRWEPGRTQRAATDSFQVGGKGINVSRMLKRLGTPTVALCFAGGSTGADCTAWLREHGLPHKAFTTDRPTRMGAVIRADGVAETTFLSPDVAPDAPAWAACAAHLDSLPDGQVLALCGSFPGWNAAEAEPLRICLARWASRGTLVADTYGPPLEWALRQPLALLKINRDEFDSLALAGTPAEPVAMRLPRALALTQTAAWVVTDGPKPVWLAERGATAAVSHTPPAVKEVSPTGSGDVLLACLLHARFRRGMTWAEALRFALPFASANAGSGYIAEFDMNQLLA